MLTTRLQFVLVVAVLIGPGVPQVSRLEKPFLQLGL